MAIMHMRCLFICKYNLLLLLMVVIAYRTFYENNLSGLIVIY